jgi:hypothetical protein
MVGQSRELQYFSAGFWVGSNPNLFFNRYRWREYLSSGEKRAAPQATMSVLKIQAFKLMDNEHHITKET